MTAIFPDSGRGNGRDRVPYKLLHAVSSICARSALRSRVYGSSASGLPADPAK